MPDLSVEVLDALYGGCDDALIGQRDGVVYADFCREADSFRVAVISAIRDVESAVAGAHVVHVEPDELVSMSEIARRLQMTREGVRKRVAGTRGPGNFPPPTGGQTGRSPLWRWTDVLRWHQENQAANEAKGSARVLLDANALLTLLQQGPDIAVLNAALDLRQRVWLEEAMGIPQGIQSPHATARPRKAKRAGRPAPVHS
ncbi:MAG TPA: hypothetical protein VMS17_02030 [Gemmataceae bacterium]|nr:hypothetical protein [Gemmataceae bacterium]